jgi:hypothetical protein
MPCLGTIRIVFFLIIDFDINSVIFHSNLLRTCIRHPEGHQKSYLRMYFALFFFFTPVARPTHQPKHSTKGGVLLLPQSTPVDLCVA